MGFILVLMHLAICLSEFLEIPDEIHSLCPYTDICNRTAVETFNANDFEIEGPYTRVQPCCIPCRCDDKCGLRMDCCFAEMDKYKLMENRKTACRSPVTGPNSDKYDNGIYYFMVQSCKIEYLNNSVSGIVDEDCLNDENGHPNVAPVSSLESKLVYVNAKCAECNDVYNYTIWNFQSDSRSMNLNNVENSTVTETKLFIAPDNVEQVDRHTCFNEFNSGKCSNNITLRRLCRNLNAPNVYKTSHYRNVFCAACSLNISTVCFSFARTAPEMVFTYLIDNSVVEMAKKISILPSGVYKGDGCLQSTRGNDILCPEGMLNTPDGCQYYITKLKIKIFTVQLKLQPVEGHTLTEEMLSVLSKSERFNPLSWFHIPYLDMSNGDIFVYKEINNDDSKPIKSFVIQLKINNYMPIELPNVIQSIRKCIDGQWSITVANSSYVMNASLDKYQEYVQDGLQRRRKIMPINDENGSQEKEARPKMFNLISMTSSILPTDIFVPIGKIFFCRNIEIPTTEVEFGYGEITILSSNVTLGDNERNITLGDNEFMIRTKVDADGKSYNVVVVCVEDFFCDRRRIYAASSGSNVMLSDIMLGVMMLGIVLQTSFSLLEISRSSY